MNYLFFSDLCPDTEPFVIKLQKLNINYQPINITQSMKNLKQFLCLRDNHPAFLVIKQKGFAGVPLLLVGNDCYFQDDDLLKIVSKT